MAIKVCRAAVRNISVEPMGARIAYDGERTSYADDIRISCGGVLFNMLFAVMGCAVFAIFRNEYVLLFITSNIALAAVNMLPISYLDGGTALYAFLCTKHDIDTAFRISRIFDRIGRAVLIAVNVFAVAASGFNIGFLALLILQTVTLLSE